MKAKLNIYLPILLVSSLILASCSSQNDIATNYYADGIYFDPDYRNVTKAVTNEQPESEAIAEESFDYYEPGTYNSPYEQQLPGSGWSNNGNYGGGYGTSGWGSSMNMGFGNSWGNPYYPYGDMYPYGGMYSGYYNPYAFNPYMYNPFMFNPYCGFGGFYGGGFYNPYNPWGYPSYGYYPDNRSGNSFHDYYSGNQPDIIIRGGSNPRPTRNTAGTTGRGGSGSTSNGRREVQTPSSTTTSDVTAAERMARTQKTTTTSASRLRSQATQQRMRTYANQASAPKTDARSAGEARQLYEKTTRTPQANRNQSSTRATSTRTQTQNATSDNAGGNSSLRNSNLSRQTQRVINNSGGRQAPSRTYTPQTRTRTYTPRSTNENQSTPSRVRSTPSSSPSSGGSSGGGRSSSGGSSGGGGRPSGGGGGSTTIRR